MMAHPLPRRWYCLIVLLWTLKSLAKSCAFLSSRPQHRPTRTVVNVPNDRDELLVEDPDERIPPRRFTVPRSSFLAATGGVFLGLVSLSTIGPSLIENVNAFEGGIGGLGKTKPQTGVEFLASNDGEAPLLQQSRDGTISAEILVPQQDAKSTIPVLVSFQAPWPLLPTTAGLEARDLQNSESAFVQVVANANRDATTSAKAFTNLLLDTVLSKEGKFGAYGTPTDVKVRTAQSDAAANLYSVTFTAYTPGQRESERQLLVNAVPVSSTNALILLVVGTTRLRFKQQRATLQAVADSLQAVPAPATSLR